MSPNNGPSDASPFVIAWREKALTTTTILAYWALGYLTLNRFDFERRVSIPSTALDDMPLVPWTIVVYHSVYLLGGLGIWLHRSHSAVWCYLTAVTVGQTINFILFAILPTAIDRPPLPEDGSMWLWAVDLTWTLDAPHTCFPSLHITSCTVAVCAFARSRTGVLFAVWTIAISASTLTTKQHLFWDLPAGAAVGGISYLLARPLSRRLLLRCGRGGCGLRGRGLGRRRRVV